MGGILGSLFLGVSFLAWHYGAIPREGQAETVLSLLANGVFGRSWFFYAIQFTTCAILVVAANTSYADFPRLTMLLAQDRFLPRQFANIGDRLVFTNGILVLALLASALIVGFGGSTHALIPLYAVGVFLSFTLSQAGMVVRWFRLKERGWQRNSLINGFGALCTAVVTGVIGYTKFTAGEPVKLFPLTTPLGLWVVLTAAAFVLVSMYRRSMARGVLVLSSLLFLGWWAATGAVGHTRVTTFDLKDPSVLAARLHASREPVSQYLSAHLSPETRELLDRFDGFGVPSDALQAGLAGDLDRLVRGPSLYDPDRFSGVRLRRDTRRLLAEPTPGAALARLNRNLLEDAYPRVLEHTRGVLHTSEVHLGAWVVILIIPILVWMFSRIHAHYHEVASHLTMEKYRPVGKFRHTVLVSVSGVHRGIMPALEYARSIGDDVRAVYVELDPSCTPGVQERWAKWVSDIPLIILDSPFRALTEPLLTYIDEVERERDDDVVTIIIPEFVTEKWWTALLHGQQGMMLKWALLFKKGIVVVNVRYHLDDTVDDDLGLHPLTSAGDREATLR
jgi:amino acid transporter